MRGNTHARSISACLMILLMAAILCSCALVAAAATTPSLQSISPDNSRPGYYVDLQGAGFGSIQGSSYVSFGPFPSTIYSSWTDTTIRCIVPDIPGVPLPVTGPVTVIAAGATSNAVSFTVLAPNPTVTSVFPPTGFSNSVVDVTITGTGFQNGAMVQLQRMQPYWGDSGIGVSNVYVASSTTITCRLSVPGWSKISFPPDYMFPTYSVYVVNPDGGQGAGGLFTPLPNPCGAGAISPMVLFGFTMGILSLAGAIRVRRSRQRP
jgi:hypothetical protein